MIPKHKINLIFLHSLSVRCIFDLVLNENFALFSLKTTQKIADDEQVHAEN